MGEKEGALLADRQLSYAGSILEHVLDGLDASGQRELLEVDQKGVFAELIILFGIQLAGPNERFRERGGILGTRRESDTEVLHQALKSPWTVVTTGSP